MKYLWTVAAVIVILLLGYGIYRYQGNVTSTTVQPTTTTPTPNQSDTAIWKTYRNEKYGFKLRYPESMIANVQEGPVVGAWTLVIYDPAAAKLARGRVPELTLTNRSYAEYAKMTRLFTQADIDSERISANIYFQEGGKDIYSSCNLFDNFETKSLRGLVLCNKILSTFKFTK